MELTSGSRPSHVCLVDKPETCSNQLGITVQSSDQAQAQTWTAQGSSKAIARNRAARLALQALFPDRYQEVLSEAGSQS